MILLLSFVGCDETIISRENNAEDIEDAQKQAASLYKAIMTNDSTTLKFMCSNQVKWGDFSTLLTKLKAANGEIKDVGNGLIKTKVTTRGKRKPLKYYEYEMKVNYSNGKTIDNFTFETQNDTLKLIGYHFKMDI